MLYSYLWMESWKTSDIFISCDFHWNVMKNFVFGKKKFLPHVGPQKNFAVILAFLEKIEIFEKSYHLANLLNNPII